MKQIHGFYLQNREKIIRFDVVIGFDAKDQRKIHSDIIADLHKEFPDFDFQVALDSDFTGE